MKTVFVLNPHAGSGTARRVWSEIEPLIETRIEDYSVVVTETIEEISPRLGEAVAAGVQRVIAVGGDGTNHAVINEVIKLNEAGTTPPLVYGNVPIGTGRDWARGLGVPIDSIPAIAEWIVNAAPSPIDLGILTYEDEGKSEYFLNIASGGLGGDVAYRVEGHVKRSWTFLASTVESILRYSPQHVSVSLDGVDWFSGKVYLVVVANGTTFGRGMMIAPNALVDDGLFDVVLAKDVSRLALLSTLRLVYTGDHLSHPAVMQGRARRIGLRIEPSAPPIKLELDGEYREGRTLTFEVRPNMLQLLR